MIDSIFFVVYLNQCFGVPHSKCELKSASSHFLTFLQDFEAKMKKNWQKLAHFFPSQTRIDKNVGLATFKTSENI